MLRRGFVLLELMVALVVGSTVVLLAYATMRGGMEAEARVSAAREDDAVMSVMRALLSDGIRHAMVGDAATDGAALTLERASTGSGAAARLMFVTRGLNVVQGAGDAWRLSLRTDSSGVTLDADPLHGARVPLRLHLGTVRGFAVRFRSERDISWRESWDDATQLPAAIMVRWLDAAGREVGIPLVARTSTAVLR
jgi:prepilin-type N-terminal cleavage/methylation domain-containing protein